MPKGYYIKAIYHKLDGSTKSTIIMSGIHSKSYALAYLATVKSTDQHHGSYRDYKILLSQ